MKKNIKKYIATFFINGKFYRSKEYTATNIENAYLHIYDIYIYATNVNVTEID